MSPQETCDFCGISEENESTGELQRTQDGSVVAHYYCMLYSPLVTEKDSQEVDTEGFGFNIESVQSEIERGQKLRCNFCKKRGATVGCDVQTCKKSYHYPCLISANGMPIPDKFIVYCAKHKYSKTANDTDRLERAKKRRLKTAASRARKNNKINHLENNELKRWQRGKTKRRLKNTTGRARKNDVRNESDDNEPKRWQRGKTKRRLKYTTGRARKNDVRNESDDDNGYSPITFVQNMQGNEQTETTFLIAIHSAVEIEDKEEALPSTSVQPMSSGTSTEESDSMLSPKVKDTFSLSGFPKQKRKSSSNRKPSEKLQEILQTMTSQEKRDLSQIYSELGGSELNQTTEMDASSENQNGDITTEDAGNSNVIETSTCSDNSESDKTPERLPDINEHGIPLRYSSNKKITEKQCVSSRHEKIPDKMSKNFSKKGKLNHVISMLGSTVSSDGDISDRPGMSDISPRSATSKPIGDDTSVGCSEFSNVQPAMDLRTQGTSETHPSGHCSMTEPESILCSPLTLENDGGNAEVSTKVNDTSLEKMENELSTSPLSNGEIFPLANPNNVKTLLNGKKALNKRSISDIASPQQITAISRKLGTLSGQFRSIVPQIQSAINSPRKTTKDAELNGDGQASPKGSSKSNANDQPREVKALKRLRSSLGWIEKKGQSKRLQSVKRLPARNNLHERLRNRGISDESIKEKDSVCLERSESISSKRKRSQDREEPVRNVLPRQTEVKLPEQQKIPETQDDDSTEDSLMEETETPGSVKYDPVSGHHSGPSQMPTPVRRRFSSLFPRDISQSSFQHERVEDLDDMDGFGQAVAGQCRRMPEDRQAKYMSYVLASADLFRAPKVLPEVDILINDLRTVLERFQKSSSSGAYSSSD